MITPKSKKEKTFCEFSNAIKKLNIAKLLRSSNIMIDCQDKCNTFIKSLKKLT
ncbi:hypothetical protein [Peptoanaerobacter stomatis]|uniref:hypothetical protein n=1 Tax=Peptoanaerobacter stomatis TaxID=796937 RepID=UPI0002DDFF6B|nr:hypothetical protein [Peptoanaerobacter stomatis]